MKISFRLSEKHDAELINYLNNFKNKNLSSAIRKILYRHFSNKSITWSIPKGVDKNKDI